MALDTQGRQAADLKIKLKDTAPAGVAHPDGYDLMPGETATVPPWLGLRLLGQGWAELVEEGSPAKVKHGDPSVTTQPPAARQQRTK